MQKISSLHYTTLWRLSRLLLLRIYYHMEMLNPMVRPWVAVGDGPRQNIRADMKQWALASKIQCVLVCTRKRTKHWELTWHCVVYLSQELSCLLRVKYGISVWYVTFPWKTKRQERVLGTWHCVSLVFFLFVFFFLHGNCCYRWNHRLIFSFRIIINDEWFNLQVNNACWFKASFMRKWFAGGKIVDIFILIWVT